MKDEENNITLNSVSKQLGDFRLDNINLVAYPQEIVGIIGENGAGKTTLLRVISQDLKLDSGTICIPSKEYIGFVFDSNHLPDELSATNLNTIFPFIFKEWEEKVFLSYLNEFKIPKNQNLKSFSKGMKMKINIAVALSHNPKFLLLDEITSGLDPLIRDHILTTIKNYVSNNNAIAIMTTHLLDDIIRIADKVIVLHEGSVSLNSKVDDIGNADDLEKAFKKTTIGK